MSQVVETGPCPVCPSSDAYKEYDDGHAHCYSCDTTFPGTGKGGALEGARPAGGMDTFLRGTYTDLRKRRINRDTCRRFGYHVLKDGPITLQVADYRDAQGNVVAQKVRKPDKDFFVRGDLKKATLFGQHLCRSDGKRIVVTEGEVDALSVSQAMDNRWPVVSVPSGAAGAKAAIKRQLEFLEGYDAVVFNFDNDEAGEKAAQECAALLSPGKAKIAHLPSKDASDMLQAGKARELVSCLWDARTFQPDGLLTGEDVWQKIIEIDRRPSVSWPWPSITAKVGRLKVGDLIVLVAGTGTGKSAVCREIGVHVQREGAKLGYIALEEGVKRTALGLMSVDLSKPLHLEENIEQSLELRSSFERVASDVVYFDHFGSRDVDNLLSRVRFMAKGQDRTFIILDHLTGVVSSQEQDERKALDRLVTGLASLANECQITIVAVSHLSRKVGTPHEEGGQTSLSHLRGSHGIAQWAYIVVGLERDQQDEAAKDITLVRSLKCRWNGYTGEVCHLRYSHEDGRIIETVFDTFANQPATPDEDPY